MRRIDSVREVAAQYEAVLCDVWGVLHDGHHLYPGVADLLLELRADGTIVLLLTNSPQPWSAIPDGLRRMGLPDEAWNAIVTSGDLTRVELARRSPGPVHRLGREVDGPLWEGLGLEFTGLSKARFVAIAGLRGPHESPADYVPELRAARARDLTLVCANPDLAVPAGDELVWCPGAVAREYALLGGRVVLTGKPHAPIYERARAEIERVAHRPVAWKQILAIGDGITTDIVGANRMGLDSVFVASGINGHALLRDGAVDVDAAQRALAESGAAATYVIDRLR